MAVALVSSGVKAPCSKITLIIGSERIMRPSVAGTVRQKTMVREDTNVSFISTYFFREAYRARTGNAAIEIATPNSPMGSCTSLKA